MKRLHILFTGLSLSIVLLSINRLTTLTSGTLEPHEFLRWLDFNAMLPIPLLSVILYYLVHLDIERSTRKEVTVPYRDLLGVLLIAGIFFFAAGSGLHEVTNYLHVRFCLDPSSTIDSSLCGIIAFNDDVFSHYVYYVGFIAMNVALMFREFSAPRARAASFLDLSLVAGNALFIALGIFANLAFEEGAIDLLFFGSVTVLALLLLALRQFRVRSLPVTFYFACAYVLGVGGTLLYKAF